MVGRQFGHGGNDVEIRVAVAHVKAAQLFAIEQKTVLIEIVVGRQNAPPRRLFGGDLPTQRTVVEYLVADEDDARDVGGRPFVDGIDQVDAVLRALDDLRIDAGSELAVPAIEFDDALNIGLHFRAREDHARLELDFLLEVLRRDLAVALERDLVDDRILDHVHRQRGAVPADLHIRKQSRREQRLQRAVDSRLAVGVADVQGDVGENGRGLDTLRAQNDDLPDDGSHFLRGRRLGHSRSARLRGSLGTQLLRASRCAHGNEGG